MSTPRRILASKIVDRADEGQHDLVVMGARGEGDLAPFALGSLNHELVRRFQVAGVVARDGAVAAAKSAASL